MRTLLYLLPMLVLSFITVDVGAHPVQLVAHASRGETNDNVQILARTNSNTSEWPMRRAIRVGILLYLAGITAEAKGKVLQKLLTIFQKELPQDGTAEELNMMHGIKKHAMNIMEEVQKMHEYYNNGNLCNADGHWTGPAVNDRQLNQPSM
jgi:hypothetical protein